MAAAGTRQGQGGRRQNEVSEIPDCLADGHRGDRLQQGQSDALKEEAVVSRHKRGRGHCGLGRARAAAGRAGAAAGAPRGHEGRRAQTRPAAPGGHRRGTKFPADSPPAVWKRREALAVPAELSAPGPAEDAAGAGCAPAGTALPDPAQRQWQRGLRAREPLRRGHRLRDCPSVAADVAQCAPAPGCAEPGPDSLPLLPLTGVPRKCEPGDAGLIDH